MTDPTTDTNGIGAVGWMRSLVIDAHDPHLLARFWCAVLDVQVVEDESDWVVELFALALQWLARSQYDSASTPLQG